MPFLPAIIALHVVMSASTQPSSTLEQQVLRELNLARADPAAYVASLRDYRQSFRDNLRIEPISNVRFITQEGVTPVDEAIQFLGEHSSTAGLTADPLLASAASDHQADQQADGAVGHAGSDGSSPSDRLGRRGGGKFVGEVIAYGSQNAADIVRQLIVDDGVAGRGHRKLLFDANLRYAGVACGPHPVYRFMCVIDMARTADGQSVSVWAHRSTKRRSGPFQSPDLVGAAFNTGLVQESRVAIASASQAPG